MEYATESNKHNENELLEIEITKKEAQHIKQILKEQEKQQQPIILNHKKLTTTFNQLQHNYLKQLLRPKSKEETVKSKTTIEQVTESLFEPLPKSTSDETSIEEINQKVKELENESNSMMLSN